jgi:hypothetical protein
LAALPASEDVVMPTIRPEPDYKEIAAALRAGQVVPFFGAGASIGCGLPSGTELAQIIFSRGEFSEGEFPDEDERRNLALVASYMVQVKNSTLKLNRLLREIFCKDTKPSALHECLASVDALRLIVTTNYDDLIERALARRRPWVVVDRGTPGNVWLRPAGGVWTEIEGGKLRTKIGDVKQPIVFKMHGSVDYDDNDHDAFTITEEDYVDFLGRREIKQFPDMLTAFMARRAFLFLGYGLKDWNVRVLMRKLTRMRPQSFNIPSWAIVRTASESERKLWHAHNVELYEVELDEFAKGLQDQLPL